MTDQVDLSAYIWPDAGFDRQPQLGDFEVDWDNPLTKGLVFVNIGGDDRNLVTGRRPTYGSGVANKVEPFGIANTTLADGNPNRRDYAGIPPPTGGAASYGAVFIPRTNSTFSYLINRGFSSPGNELFWLSDAGYKNIRLSFGTGGLVVGDTNPTLGVVHVASASTPPENGLLYTSCKIFTDGYKNNLTTFGGAANASAVGSTSTTLILHGRSSDNARQLAGGTLLAVSWNRVLTDDEHYDFNRRPWQIIRVKSLAGSMVLAGGAGASLAATATAQSTATADLSHGVTLAAAALSVASATAGMSHSVPLAGSASAVASATGALSLTVNFAANAVAQAVATASLSVGGSSTLAANAAAVASAGATLSLVVNLSASAVAHAVASAELGGAVSLAAAAIAQASATSALAVGKPLGAAAAAQATAGATISLVVPLTAAALAQAAASGALSLSISLATSAVANAGATATFATVASLASNGVAVASASASLSVSSATVAGARVGPRMAVSGSRPARLQTSARPRR